MAKLEAQVANFETEKSRAVADAKLEAANATMAQQMALYNRGLQNGYNMAKGTASPSSLQLPSFNSPASGGSTTTPF